MSANREHRLHPRRQPYAKPSITELEVNSVLDAVQSGWGEDCYRYIDLFEESVREVFQTRFAVATSSCTGAITLALATLGIGPGDEVILSDANWVAAVSPVIHLGATPVFCDVSPVDWCLTASNVEAKITPRTKAVIVTHLYGNVAPIDDITAIGQVRGIPVIEDAAEALGSRSHGRLVGTLGTIGVFSLHGTKTLTSGEGGFLVTDDEEIYQKVRQLNNHGRGASEHNSFTATIPGYKFKISNIQAALAFAQLSRLDELVKRKREIFSMYSAMLSDGNWGTMNPEPPETANSYWMPTLILDPRWERNAKQVLDNLLTSDIQARPFFPPLSSFPFTPEAETPISSELHMRGLNLPSYHDMEEADVVFVVEALQKALL